MSTGYSFSIENGADNFPEIEPLYRSHYAEKKARFASQGLPCAPLNMRMDVYNAHWRAGTLINYIARQDGRAVGYANIYLTASMHTGELIAVEDAIYVLPPHRNGTGRNLMKFILSDLAKRGVTRADGETVTDPRVAKLWHRMGFRKVGEKMSYFFGAADHVWG